MQYFGIIYDIPQFLESVEKEEARLHAVCFMSVGRLSKDYLTNPDAHFMNGFNLESERPEVFIKSFNRIMKTMQFVIHKKLPFDERLRYAYGIPKGVNVSTYYVELLFDPKYNRTTQWLMSVPLLQILRGFSPQYAFYRNYRNDHLKGVIDYFSGKFFIHYGLWTEVKIPYKNFKRFADPDFMNMIDDKYSDKIINPFARFPYGTRLCQFVNKESEVA